MWSVGCSTLFLVLVHILDHTVATVLQPSCTFDNGWCQWRPQNSTQGFQWHLGNGSTPDRSSGPVGDHTTKYSNGSYIFIKGIDARMNSSIKAVVEANIDVTSDLQLSFWYFMNGVGIGILTLNKIDGNGSKTELWRRKGRQGREWIQATVNLPRGSFVISFEATARLFYGSDLAVDDIEISPIRTTTNPPLSTLPPAMELPFQCDFDFESGWCDMKLLPSPGNSVGWNITSGPILNKGKILISGDFSRKGRGKFLLLNNWNMGENGDAAQIISPVLESTGAACLSFYLYLATATSGTLSIYQRFLPSMKLVLLHEASYKNPPGWKSLMFTVNGTSYFQIILEGSYTDSRFFGSVMGVDDVTIQNGECILTTTPSTTERTSPKPSTTEFKVSTTQVGISSSQKTTHGSSTLPPTTSTSHLSSPYSTKTSTTLSTQTTKRIQPSTRSSSSSDSSTSKLGHTTSSYRTLSFSTTQKSNTTTNHPEISSAVTISQIPTKSSTHLPWLSSTQTSKSSTNSSSVATTKKETVFISSKFSSTQSSLQTNISSITTLLPFSKRTTTTSVIKTKTSSPSTSKTTNTAKPTTHISNSLPPSTFTGSTSIILSSLITDVSKFTFQPSITTRISERSTGKQSSQHTLSSGIPEMKCTTSTITQALTGSHTTSLITSSTSPASTNETNKLAGRETTAIVLGVCLPIILLVILSVIVLICKKDHSKHKLVENKSKVEPHKEKYRTNTDTIELDANISVKGFRKLET
ncbi:MAM and LDL-receptor class A domain-containing protein 2-like [Saccostrea cucullata]|uniref:MAM and LDL-receptor class A domain-containing protein 2-like n=1 Tax=Saccostrea cuccullata TaxID=36930 RepID=UPI002ED450D1